MVATKFEKMPCLLLIKFEKMVYMLLIKFERCSRQNEEIYLVERDRRAAGQG